MSSIRASVHQQQGAFAIEMAFVLAFLVTLFLFSADLSQQVLNRAKLDRVSYSLVNLVKERQRFYAEREPLSRADFLQIQEIAARLLHKSTAEEQDQFGISVQSLVEGTQVSFSKTFAGDTPCVPDNNISTLSELVPENDAGKRFPLYQVTLCMTSSSWYDKAIGQHLISATSVMPGR
ncbi:tight adherence pilus pseudopilin TadF [Ferrimonas sp. YFM]|uniref:tight adherence pilus pseudopilin TadF n=1 Tax=Ferrimonas sp. YFM TaxID=3028878 RepID=UPI0025728295|nr:tight adherence pilus pseudopilin TadF [Ferrimonas sp. YFM]BDY04203.1 ATP-binding protein [Ferrimonas sp. YFM]